MKRFIPFGLLMLLTLAFYIPINAQQQAARFGVKAGLNISQFGGKTDESVVNDLNTKLGYNLGVTLDIALSKELYLMTGAEFSAKGVSEIRRGQDVSVNAMYMVLPLQLGYKKQFVKDAPVFIMRFGPYVGYGIAGKMKNNVTGESVDTFSDDAYKNVDFGLGLSVGAEFSQHYTVDIGYNLGLTTISQKTQEKIKARNFFVNVGYKF